MRKQPDLFYHPIPGKNECTGFIDTREDSTPPSYHPHFYNIRPQHGVVETE